MNNAAFSPYPPFQQNFQKRAACEPRGSFFVLHNAQNAGVELYPSFSYCETRDYFFIPFKVEGIKEPQE